MIVCLSRVLAARYVRCQALERALTLCQDLIRDKCHKIRKMAMSSWLRDARESH